MTPEVVCEFAPAFVTAYEYKHTRKCLTGVSAMMYLWMVKVFGKEAADREYWDLMVGNENGGLSTNPRLQDHTMEIK